MQFKQYRKTKMAWHYNFKSRQGRSQNFCLKRGFDLFLPFSLFPPFLFFISLLFFFCLLFLLSFPFLVLEVGLLKCSQRIWGTLWVPQRGLGLRPSRNRMQCIQGWTRVGSTRGSGHGSASRQIWRVGSGPVEISEMRYFVLYRRS